MLIQPKFSDFLTGKQAFALGAPENGAEIDYMDPWNARADGYQTTGGSSS